MAKADFHIEQGNKNKLNKLFLAIEQNCLGDLAAGSSLKNYSFLEYMCFEAHFFLLIRLFLMNFSSIQFLFLQLSLLKPTY